MLTRGNSVRPRRTRVGAFAKPQIDHVGTSVRLQWVIMGTSVHRSFARVGTPRRQLHTQRRALASRHLALVVASAQPQLVQMGTPVQLLHSRAGPLFNRINILAVKRENFVTLVQRDSTINAERVIARSVHCLCRGVTIHDYNVRPITWRHQEMCKTSLASNLCRRLTDRDNQSIWGL